MTDSWAKPEFCPICGGQVTRPDDIDPELIDCDSCGRMHVEISRD